MGTPNLTQTNDLGVKRSPWRRATGGLRRRLRYAWRRLGRTRTQSEAVQAAWNWLAATGETNSPSARQFVPPGHSQQADLPQLAEQVAELMARQRHDGAIEAGSPQATRAATVEFLATCQRQVEVTFDELTDALPQQIDPQDGRVRAVRRWLKRWATAGARVADIGCGSGRFLAQLCDHTPPLRLLGIDPSLRMLAHVPRQIDRAAGSLLALPMADASCDGVFCVESLEHALLPQLAVAELCRVTRPGGRILIIDKHTQFQPLSEHLPWERWFTPEEVFHWLEPYCCEVVIRPIPHGGTDVASGLFQCWSAIRA